MSLLWFRAALDTGHWWETQPLEPHVSDLYHQSGISYGTHALQTGSDAYDEAEGHLITSHLRNRHGMGEGCPAGCGQSRRIDLSVPLHGMEPNIDPDTVRQYMKQPSNTGRNGSRPNLMKLNGEHHIVDGHHRLMAARLRGDQHADVDYMDVDHFLAHPEQHHVKPMSYQEYRSIRSQDDDRVPSS